MSLLSRCTAAALFILLLLPIQVCAESANLGSSYIRPIGGLKTGDLVPPFHAKDIYGQDLDLTSLLENDNKVILAFWSMYCQACIEKFRAMTAIQKKYKFKGLVVISVNTDGEYRKGEKVIRDFIEEYGQKNGFTVNFPVLYDETNWLALALNIDFLPSIVTLDKEGKVLDFYRGFNEVGDEAILASIEKLVDRMYE